MDAVVEYLENCSQIEVDIEVVESLLKPESRQVSPRYLLKHSTRDRKIFQFFDTSEKPRTTLWQAEHDLWRVIGDTVHGKRVGKTSGMILSIKELWQKPTVPRQNPTNAVAAAKFAVSQRRRRPLGRDGRQAKARYCLREMGKGNAEIPG